MAINPNNIPQTGGSRVKLFVTASLVLGSVPILLMGISFVSGLIGLDTISVLIAMLVGFSLIILFPFTVLGSIIMGTIALFKSQTKKQMLLSVLALLLNLPGIFYMVKVIG